MKLLNKKVALLLVILISSFSVFAQGTATLVAAGSSWKYLDNGSNQGTAWRATSFNDASWATGNAKLGYGQSDVATVVSYGPLSILKYVTTYFRKSITIPSAAAYTGYTLRVKRDDGIVVYVNGTERYRNNMPTGTISSTTLASAAASDNGNTWQSVSLPASAFTSGTNVIAVEIHLVSRVIDTDIAFDLDLTGTLADLTPPTVTNYSPANGSTNVAPNVPLVLTFSEPVVKGTGSIQIRQNGTVTQTINVTSTSVTVSSNTVTIAHTNFTNNAAVNIQMPAGTFRDAAANNYAGITNATTWAFTVQPPPDVTPPTVTTYSPANNATNVANNAALTLTFSEAVQKGSGNIVIKEAGVVKQTIDVTSADVTVSGNTVSIAHSVFTYSTLVNIEMPAGTIKDLAGNNYAGITNTTTWRFTVQANPDVTPPTVSTYSPANNAVNITPDATTVLTFSEPVQKGTGNIVIKENGVTRQTISVTAAAVTVLDNTVTIAHTAFTYSSLVNIEIAAGAIKDLAGNNYAGITNTTTWRFTIQDAPDTTPPTVTTYSPANNTTGVANNASLVLTFSEAVQKGTGNIVIKENGVTTQTVDVNTSAVTITGNTVTIAHANFTNSALVNIEMPAGTIKDIAGNNYAGITNNTTWRFTILTPADNTPPTVTTYSPANNATNIAKNAALILTFSEPVQKGSGSIVIRENGTIKQTIDVTIPSVVVSGNTVTIGHANFSAGASVNIQMPAGTFQDLSNNNFTGISNATTWQFTVAAASVTTLIAPESMWKYLDNGTDQGTAWRNLAYDDAAWPSGIGELGYGDRDERTVIGFGPNSNSKYITYYFRKTINITDASLYSSYTLSVRRDDGVVVYVNGVEVMRDNMPAGNITYTTLAPTAPDDDGYAWIPVTLPAGTFVSGNNIIAVEVHQNTANSSDLSFDLQLTATDATTDTDAPFVTSYAPANNATGVVNNPALVLNFNENVLKGTGSITISENGVVTQSIDVASSAVAVSGSTVTITPSAIFAYTANVSIQMPAGTFTDVSSNYFAGINNNTTWAFSVQQSPELTAPVVNVYAPAQNATGVAKNATLALTFSKPVQKGTGTITLKENGVVFQTINVTSSDVVVSGNTVTIAHGHFLNNALVNIEISAGAFKDLNNNNFAGITDATTWRFTTVAASQVTLVASKSAWKYLDNGTDQGTAWQAPAFNDASWATGNAELGYGDGDEATIVSYGPNSSSRYITTYFRKTFNIPDASMYTSYTLGVRRDDGAVVYINGVEKFRTNMPSGTITYTTLAPVAAADDGTEWQTAVFPAGTFVSGNNTIAVEVHQNTVSSSDLSFDLQLFALDSTDRVAPVVATLAPADDATNVSNSISPLVITFSEKMIKGTGNITIKENGVLKQTIAVSSTAVTIADNVVSIVPTASFAFNAVVNVEIPAGAFTDYAGNSYAGITTTTGWNFTIAPTVIATTLLRGPYLQMGTSNSIMIKWRTAAAVGSKVTYGTSQGALNLVKEDTTKRTNHEVVLTGLQPDTKYFYTIGLATQTLQGDSDNFFVTAPLPGTEKKTRIWVNGDCGNNSTNQRNVRDRYLSYMGSNYTDAWLLLGDNAYENGTDSEYQVKFFDIYKDKMLKQTVLWPAPGNHDYANSGARAGDLNVDYFNIFQMPTAGQAGGVPSGTKRYYSFNYGNIHFISLDSYGKDADTYRLYDTTGPQVTWLKQDLAANTQKWTILYWHHPPYTMGSHNSDVSNELIQIRQNLLRILDRYKVDLVLCGHSHNYERSRIMKGYYGNEASFNGALYNLSSSSGKYDGSSGSCPYVKNSTLPGTGIVYTVVGSSGQLSTVAEDSYPHDAMYFSNNTVGGSMALEIEGDRLDAKWICSDGTIRDQYTIVKDAAVKKNISINSGASTTLTASWIGSYNWTGGATTRSISVSPTVSTTYIVQDQYSCLADTFNVTVNSARPLKPATTIDTENTDNLSDGGIKVYPNPSTGNATIEYSVQKAETVSLDIIDMTGRKIKTLVQASRNSGIYNYLLNAKAEQLKPGIYTIRLIAGKQQSLQKFVILQK
jgi:methionine-rich copper-binding protein CopC/hemin uptake protein HemP